MIRSKKIRMLMMIYLTMMLISGTIKIHFSLGPLLMMLMTLMMLMMLMMLLMMIMLMMLMILMMMMALMMGSANACPSPLPGEEGSDTEQMRSRRGCNIVLRDARDRDGDDDGCGTVEDSE